jgi:hypothetical protein
MEPRGKPLSNPIEPELIYMLWRLTVANVFIEIPQSMAYISSMAHGCPVAVTN